MTRLDNFDFQGEISLPSTINNSMRTLFASFKFVELPPFQNLTVYEWHCFGTKVNNTFSNMGPEIFIDVEDLFFPNFAVF